MTPSKKRRNSWIAGLIIASPFLWTIPTFYYMRAETAAKNTSCQSTLRSFGAIIQSYARDNDNRLPDAKNWVEEVRRYSPQGEGFKCFSDPDTTHPVSYAMNANLSGKKLRDIKNPSQVILVYETKSKQATPFGTGQDMADIGKPANGQGRHNKVGYRFNFFLMVDGTVREAGTPDEKKPLRWTP